MSFCRFTPSQVSTLLTNSSSFLPLLSSVCLLPRHRISCKFSTSVMNNASSSSANSEEEHIGGSNMETKKRWRPMCLYFTQGKCTMTDDATHLDKFNHGFSTDLQVNASKLGNIKSQDFDRVLVLDLEGKVEILEFPVLMIDTRTMEFIDSFHRFYPVITYWRVVWSRLPWKRFVRPSGMSEKRINEYIQGKYGKFGVDRVWHDTAIPFTDVLNEFELWLNTHDLWTENDGGSLNQAAFVTCGNWDIKTKIPEQCKVSKIKLPSYFMEWINLKDIYLNFYNRRATGMMTMLRELKIQITGSHHLGIDDSKNIARVVQHLLGDGALLQLTAKRSISNPPNVKFLFNNRI